MYNSTPGGKFFRDLAAAQAELHASLFSALLCDLADREYAVLKAAEAAKEAAQGKAGEKRGREPEPLASRVSLRRKKARRLYMEEDEDESIFLYPVEPAPPPMLIQAPDDATNPDFIVTPSPISTATSTSSSSSSAVAPPPPPLPLPDPPPPPFPSSTRFKLTHAVYADVLERRAASVRAAEPRRYDLSWLSNDSPVPDDVVFSIFGFLKTEDVVQLTALAPA